MEKYFVILTVLAMLLFALCTMPVMSSVPTAEYVVCENTALADKICPKSEKWQNADYYVYRLSAEDAEKAILVPNGIIVKEYYFENYNNIFTEGIGINDLLSSNPFLKEMKNGDSRLYGMPYIID